MSGRGRSPCPFYETMDSILGTRASSSPISLLDSGGNSPLDSALVAREIAAEEEVQGRLLKCIYVTWRSFIMLSAADTD